MKVSVVARSAREVPADLLALPVFELPEKGWKLPKGTRAVDRALSGALGAAVAAGDFRGKRGQTHLAYGGGKVAAKRVLLVGLGEEEKIDGETLRRAAGQAVSDQPAPREEGRDARRKHQDRLSEDYGDNACGVNAQRYMGALSTIYASSDHSFRILDRYLPHPLCHDDDTRNNHHHQSHQENQGENLHRADPE